MALIHDPKELRSLSLDGLRELAEDLRQEILSACLKNGGHLGASLGAVELALALHAAFESPKEPIVWDVGHQAYAHKLLTGRWESFSTLRTKGGISGFLSRDESPHDAFGAGHSSTALSAALAMAWARRASTDWTVAVVGDGGLTAGLALEALNNFRSFPIGRFLLVLNDNEMSISPNVGAVSQFLRSSARDWFGLYGFDYLGPLDGHDLSTLIPALRGIRASGATRPVVLHALTEKGRGYGPAEKQPAAYHGVSPVREKVPGAAVAKASRTYSDAFGESLCKLARKDAKICAITAAMPEGTGLAAFAREFPDRFFDVGIAEPHAVTFAAGLATQGFHPVVAIYSTFLQRALDSVIHDVALQRLGVTLAIDRAGVVGADGPTHHGAFDLAYLGMVPGLALYAPTCLNDIEPSLERAVLSGRPAAIRYPRGGGQETWHIEADSQGLRWIARPRNPKLVVAALGASAPRAEAAVESLGREDVTLVAVSQAVPIPEGLVDYIHAEPGAHVLTVEDGSARGGFGEALIARAAMRGPRAGRAEIAAYGSHFIPQGSPAELEELEGLSPARLLERMKKLLV